MTDYGSNTDRAGQLDDDAVATLPLLKFLAGNQEAPAAAEGELGAAAQYIVRAGPQSNDGWVSPELPDEVYFEEWIQEGTIPASAIVRDVSVPGVADQQSMLQTADQPHADILDEATEPRSARKLMKALRQGEGNVRISEEGRQGDADATYIPKSFDGSKKEILKVFKRLLKESEPARELLEEAFGSGQEISIRPQDDVVGGTAFYPDSESGVVGPDGQPGTPVGGSLFLELDDLRGLNPKTYPGMEGGTISSTPETTLMHELSHAVHSARGVENPKVGEYGNDKHEPREMSAIFHENEARNDLGLPRRAADYEPL